MTEERDTVSPSGERRSLDTRAVAIPRPLSVPADRPNDATARAVAVALRALERAAWSVYYDGTGRRGNSHAAMVEPLYQALTHLGSVRALHAGAEDTRRDELDTAAGFLSERRDFLHVYAAPSVGDGWDVVIRVDGSYPERTDAEGAARGIREWIERLVDVRRDGPSWWGGPPWRSGGR